MKLFRHRGEFATVRPDFRVSDEDIADRGFGDLGERHPALASSLLGDAVPAVEPEPAPEAPAVFDQDAEDSASLMDRVAVKVIPRRGSHFQPARKLIVPAGCATQ